MIRSRPAKFSTSSNSAAGPFLRTRACGLFRSTPALFTSRDIESLCTLFQAGPLLNQTVVIYPGLSIFVLEKPRLCSTSLSKTASYLEVFAGIGIAFRPLKEFLMDQKLENIRLLTLSEAAILLQVSTRTLQRMIRNRELPAFKVGGQWRLRETQLRQWVESREGSVVEAEKESGEP
jgi:excisionase family DNA binding protein